MEAEVAWMKGAKKVTTNNSDSGVSGLEFSLDCLKVHMQILIYIYILLIFRFDFSSAATLLG